ncbi:hypothetical protein E4U30_002757 [Claviceps sp. LM220 group G6]|nr:hypothetical protein E4U30_002757 [Claviceps sp. LM220 group G6]
MVTSYRATGKRGSQGARTIPGINTNGRGAPEANNAAKVGDNFTRPLHAGHSVNGTGCPARQYSRVYDYDEEGSGRSDESTRAARCEDRNARLERTRVGKRRRCEETRPVVLAGLEVDDSAGRRAIGDNADADSDVVVVVVVVVVVAVAVAATAVIVVVVVVAVAAIAAV